MAEPERLSPLNFDDLRLKRREAIEQATQREIARRKQLALERAPLVAPPLIDLNDPLRNIPNPDPDPVPDEPDPEPRHFGQGAMDVAADVMQTERERNLARYFPVFQAAGQFLPLSGRIGQRIAGGGIALGQRLLPGKQEMERLVDENIRNGMSYVDALDDAWKRRNHEGGVTIPFAHTALTPKGSVTVEWEDVAAVFTDPLDVAMGLGTGGAAKRTAAKAARELEEASLRAAPRPSALPQRPVPPRNRPRTFRGGRPVGESNEELLRQTRPFGKHHRAPIPDMVQRGKRALLDRIDLESRRKPRAAVEDVPSREGRGIHPAQAEAMKEFIRALPDETLATLGSSFVETLPTRTEGLLGQYNPAQELMTIFNRAIFLSPGAQEPMEVVIHEIAHHLQRFIPPEDFARLRKVYEKQKSEALEKLERTTNSLTIDSTISPEELFLEYRFTNLGEWFAEMIAERGYRDIAFGKDRAAFERARDTIGGLGVGMSNWLRGKGFQDESERVYRNLLAGDYVTPQPDPEVSLRLLQVPGVRPATPPPPASVMPPAAGPRRVVARLPDLDLAESQAFTERADRVGKWLRPDEARDPSIARRIIGGALERINPTMVAGNNLGRRAVVLLEGFGAMGANAVSASRDYILAAGDPKRVFGLSRDMLVKMDGITLTPQGRRVFQSKNLPMEGPFAFGDIAEYWLSSEAPDLSLFQGLNETQREVLDRMRRVYTELARMAKAEGILGAGKGDVPGRQFADHFGAPGEIFHWHHRRALGKTIINEKGETEDLLFRAARGGKPGRPFEKTRTYELMQEGVREGIQYADPMEAMEALQSAVYRAIAQKRAVDYIERSGKLVTGAQVIDRLYPFLNREMAAADALLNATEANLGRVMRKLANRRAKAPLLDEAKDSWEAEARTQLRQHDKAVQRIRVEAAQVMKFLNQSYFGANDGVRRRAKKLYLERLGRFGVAKEEAERIITDYKRAARRTVAAQRRITRHDSDVFAVTNNRAIAEAEVALARAHKARVAERYADTMKRVVESADLDSKVFGHTVGRTEITHFSDGPLAGKLAPRGLAEALNVRFKDRGSRALGAIEQVTGTARTLSAGAADVGWLGIQGALLAIAHPLIYAKAALRSLTAIFNPTLRAKYIAENMDDVLAFIENGGDIGSTEFFQSLDRMGLLGRLGASLQRKLPEGSGFDRAFTVVRRINPITRLGTGFNTFLDTGKIELWKSLRGPLSRGGLNDREIASHINNMLGTMNTRFLGVSPTQRQIEGALLLFSPRYTRSAFALMAELARPLGIAGTVDGLATREAYRAIGSFLAGSTFIMYGIGQATGQEVQLNPFKPGWLTATIGGQKVGVSGVTRALLDTMFKMSASLASFEDREPLDLLRFNLFDARHRAENPILQFVLGRTAPGVRELLTQETFDGQRLEGPVDITKALAQEFIPFALQAQFFPPPGVEQQSAVALIPEVTGLRARQLSAYERFAAEKERLAQEAHGVPWDQLDNDQKAVLRRDSDKLRVLEEASRAAQRDTPTSHYFDRRLKDRTEHTERLAPIAAEFRATGNGRTFRERYDETTALYRASIQRTSREFPEVEKQLAEGRDERAQTPFNALVDRYSAEVRDNPDFVDEFGNPMWDEITQAERAFEAEVGAETFQRIRRYFMGIDDNGQPLRDDVPPEVYELRRAREVLREAGYWRIADDIVGEDPEARAIWRQYENSDNPIERQALKRRFPNIRRIERIVDRARLRIRRSNPEVDRALMRFYGLRAASREGRLQERQQRATFLAASR